MKSRQTFYISKSVSEKVKRIAYKRRVKISTLVDDALTSYLDKDQQVTSAEHSLLKSAGKIRSFRSVDPIAWQKKIRSEWEHKYNDCHRQQRSDHRF